METTSDSTAPTAGIKLRNLNRAKSFIDWIVYYPWVLVSDKDFAEIVALGLGLKDQALFGFAMNTLMGELQIRGADLRCTIL